MEQGVEVDAPLYSEKMRHHNTRCILVPYFLLYALKGWHTKVIGDTKNLALPRSLLRRQAQLLSKSSRNQNHPNYSSDNTLNGHYLFPLHSSLSLFSLK